MRRCRPAWVALVLAAGLAGCADRTLEAELAQARAGLRDALISARLAEVRVSAELYLQVPGDVADLQAEIALLHRLLEIGTEARALAAMERQRKEVEEQLARARLELERDGGDGASVATPRRAALAEASERARLWRRTVAVATRRADALIPRLQAVAASEAPAQRDVAELLRDLAGVRRLVTAAFGADEGDVGFSTREQFEGLESKLLEALGEPEALDPASPEPVDAAVAPDVRVACDSAVGAVKFWRQFSLPSLAGTQLAELLRAALRPSSGWLAIAARSPEPDEATAERVAALLGVIGVLHADAEPPLEGLEGWTAEVLGRGLAAARVQAVEARLAQWFPDAVEEGR